MNEYDLISGEIFDDEFEACKMRNNQNTPEERELIHQMASAIEHLFYLDKTGTRNEIAVDRNIADFTIEYHSRLTNGFELNKNPYPYFYFTRDHVLQYGLCREVVSFQDKETFDLFLLFKLRNLSLHKLMEWLDGLHDVHGAAFLPFLKLHLDTYGAYYKEPHLKNIERWVEEKGTQPAPIEPLVLSFSEKLDSGGIMSAPQLTNAQWAYLFYFFFKHYGLDVRSNIDVAAVAKLVHLSLGKPFSKLSNSDIYKILSKAPSYHKSSERNIDDMETVKATLLQFGLNDVAKFIDEEIRKEKNF